MIKFSNHTFPETRIGIIALGGTISSMADNSINEFYNSPSLTLLDILSTLPLNKNIRIQTTHLFQKISQNLTENDLFLLAKEINQIVLDEQINGLVVTMGTNAIEEVAYFISLLIQTNKTIVFTGAFRPYNALGYDGARNLYNAIQLASNIDIKKLGVVLTFNDCIVSAREACKLNPSLQNNFSVYTTDILGYIQSENIYIKSFPPYKHTYKSEFSINQIQNLAQTYILYCYIGMDSSLIKTALANGTKGIVFAGMGKGYMPESIKNSLHEAVSLGIIMVRCSRTGEGLVNSDKNYDSMNMIAGGTLSPAKARILLSMALIKTQQPYKIQKIFEEH